MNANEKFISALTGAMQSLRDTLQTMLTDRRIDTAIGAQLDVLGKIVGQPRNGLVDADYRRYIRARILTNKSNGRISEVIRIAKLITAEEAPRIKVENDGVAALVVNLEDVPISRDLAAIVQEFMLQAVGGGVRVYVRYTPSALAGAFALDGLGVGAGLGWTGNAALGGTLAGAVE